MAPEFATTIFSSIRTINADAEINKQINKYINLIMIVIVVVIIKTFTVLCLFTINDWAIFIVLIFPSVQQ